MHRRPKRALVTSCSFLAILILVLAACGPSGSTAPSSTTPTASSKPVKGGTWIDDLYEDVNSFIPNGSTETYAILADQTIWAPLFLGTPTGEITAGIAQEVPTLANGDISSDLKTWTFKLKPGLKWSDGQPLTAKDIDFTWKLWTNASFGAASTTGYNLIKSATVASDNQSITFHLSQPFSPFLSVWVDGGLAPMPEHIFASIKPADVLKSPESLHPSVSSGPFTMTTSKPGVQYVMTRNPNYYQAAQGLPYLDSIVFRVVADQDTILKDFQSGAINSSWFLDVTKTSSFKALNGYSLVQAPASAGYEAIFFNEKNPLLKDVTIRHAVALAINPQTLVSIARHGQAAPLCTEHPSGVHPGFQADAPCPKYDPAAAKTLLENAGWKLGADKVYAKNGQRLEFIYSTTANNAWRAEDEAILQQELAAVGIKIDITNYPGSTYFGTVLPQGQVSKYGMAEFEETYTYDADDSNVFSCNQFPTAANSYGGGNYAFYCNPALDKLYTQEQQTADPTARQAIFNKIHQIFLTDFPIVTEYEPHDIAVVKSTGHNYVVGAEGSSETVNVMNWWCTGGKC
ncbi:MAG: peptide ABC transporter substrate-binding protein [Ktedonobacteraceae bacterium]|nr:peptide ABC transporter substrate-binding protein [Ktedonobacteraceae bacterium]